MPDRQPEVRCMFGVSVGGMLRFSFAKAVRGFDAEAALGDDFGRGGCGVAMVGVR